MPTPRRLIPCTLALALAGCALAPPSLNRSEEQAAALLVASAERTICRDIPVGAWLRLYADHGDRQDAWVKLCTHQVALPAIPDAAR